MNAGHPLSSGVDARAGRWADEARESATTSGLGTQSPGAKPSKQDPPVDWRARSQVLENAVRYALAALESYLQGESGLPFTEPYGAARKAAEYLRSALSLGLPDEEGEGMRPASAARLRLMEAVAVAIESGLEPDTVRSAVEEMLDPDDSGDGAAPPPRGAAREALAELYAAIRPLDGTLPDAAYVDAVAERVYPVLRAALEGE